jgi:lipopolysaccharide transport system permease protein
MKRVWMSANRNVPTALDRCQRGHMIPQLGIKSTEWLRELWRYRELFYFLAWRDVKVRYKQTVLGIMWAAIQPLLSMFVFTLLFGNLAQMPSEGAPYPIFYFAALLPWIYFSGTLLQSGNSLVNNAQLFTKVYFPRIILPASAAISGLVDFSIGSILLFLIILYYQILPGWQLLLWPVLVVPLVLFSLGTSMILAAANVKYRDIKYTIPFIIQLLLFITPVIYPMAIIPAHYQTLIAINPMSGVIEAFRATLIPTKTVDWQLLGISSGINLLIFTLAVIYFRKTEQTFADIV